LQRAASIVGDRGNFGDAFSLAREATDWHLLGGNMVGVGRTFVDRGMWLYYLENYQEAIAMQERALHALPATELRYRFAALQGLGLYHKALGDLETAQHFSEQAGTEGEGLGVLLTGKQTWLHASIYADRGAYDEAEALLEEVTTVFADIHTGEQALATIDLAEVQLKAGKSADAFFSAQALLPLLTPLGAQNKIVRAAEHALRELASRGAGAMTAGLVTHLRDLVKSIRRERALWRSLLQMT
jgi:tetratricopeptide (TPR) repeat protein